MSDPFAMELVYGNGKCEQELGVGEDLGFRIRNEDGLASATATSPPFFRMRRSVVCITVPGSDVKRKQ